MNTRRALAPLARFLIVRASWRAIDDCDARLNSQNEAWIGWMAAPPNDWGAIRSRWTKIADASCMDDADLIFGARPSGVGAPFLESEELKRNGSERVALLDVSLVMTLSVPRVWSQEWIEARDAEHLWPREMMIESALSECGFESVMPLGRIFTCSGPDYWANVANRERGRWEALDQARVLNAELPEAPSQGSRAL